MAGGGDGERWRPAGVIHNRDLGRRLEEELAEERIRFFLRYHEFIDVLNGFIDVPRFLNHRILKLY
jgi:hypothetical protein